MTQREPPQRPTAAPQKQGSCFSIMLVGVLSLAVFSVLFVLSLGHILPVLVIGGLFFAVTGFHYLVWGWWLGSIIQAEAEAEQDD